MPSEVKGLAAGRQPLKRKIPENISTFFADFGFKKLFGQESTKQCLVDFLNAVLHRDDDPITGLDFRSTEQR